jgi:uncharacterized protein
MTKEQLFKKFYNLNKWLYRRAKNPLKCHGPDHHFRVYKNADYIIKKLKIKPDYSILIPAIFLHDITAFEPDKPTMDPWNHQGDLDDAKKALFKLRYPADKIKKILGIIAVHGSNQKKIKKDEPIEATLLRDADKMDVMGQIGIARIFMALTRRGYDLKDFVQKYHREQNIREKYQAIKTKTARDLVRKDYEYSLKFFGELDKKLKD